MTVLLYTEIIERIGLFLSFFSASDFIPAALHKDLYWKSHCNEQVSLTNCERWSSLAQPRGTSGGKGSFRGGLKVPRLFIIPIFYPDFVKMQHVSKRVGLLIIIPSGLGQGEHPKAHQVIIGELQYAQLSGNTWIVRGSYKILSIYVVVS